MSCCMVNNILIYIFEILNWAVSTIVWFRALIWCILWIISPLSKVYRNLWSLDIRFVGISGVLTLYLCKEINFWISDISALSLKGRLNFVIVIYTLLIIFKSKFEQIQFKMVNVIWCPCRNKRLTKIYCFQSFKWHTSSWWQVLNAG